MKAAVRIVVAPLAAALVSTLAITGCTATRHASAPSVGATGSPAISAVGSPPVGSASVVVSSPPPASSASAAASLSPTSAPTPTPTPTHTPKPVVTTTPPAPKPKPTTPAPPPPLLVEQLASVGNARQVVIVTSSSWTTDVATLQTFEKDAAGWHPVFPAMAAHIGRAGFSADKHEGDLKTPAGMYGFGTAFGQRPNPGGLKFPYRQADSQSVWVDDVNSPYYNTWQENAALSGEHLASSSYVTAYAYAIAIAYNVNPIVKGKGSAIFLHLSTGGGTAGCVSIAQANLLQVLRWLDPTKSPVIVMGPSSVIRQY